MDKNISSGKLCCFISSVFKKIIPNYTTPTFQEVGGVTQPRIFCRWHKNFSWNLKTISKVIDFYSQGNFTFVFATVLI